MNEDLQIKIAAGLADSKSPEVISGERAEDFVGQMLRKEKRSMPLYMWYGAAAVVAASVMFAVPLFRMGQECGADPAYQLMEKQSVHSDVFYADSTVVDSLETIIIVDEVVE